MKRCTGRQTLLASRHLSVTGTGPLASNRVQLQNPIEVAANTGSNGSGNLTGDGTALELNLTAINVSGIITLINNLTSDPITGFFERGTTHDLYEEGEIITNAGYDGTATISYVGGDGNDVVLNLVPLLGDFNSDGTVDMRDYVVWRKTGTNGRQGYTRLAGKLWQICSKLRSSRLGCVACSGARACLRTGFTADRCSRLVHPQK